MLSPIEDKYWQFLRNPRVLRQAAHLADKDSRFDFQDSFIERQVFSYWRDSIITEIVSALDGDRYVPAPIFPVHIPKTAYSQRPGATLPYRDRVLLQAIIMCIAPTLDEALVDGVWSWRVKPDARGKTPDQMPRRGIFAETDITGFPFLRRRTVSRYLDDFEPWYALWPKFERGTRAALRDTRYKYMVFSDIAGYFENIELSLLHGLILRAVPDAPNTVNLLFRHLSVWSQLTHDGTQVHRGIPQGNSISSVLGNFFLKPVDDYFEDHFPAGDIRYFRYMDDIRIVTTTERKAWEAALKLEDLIRRCKLNLQSSKTQVLPVSSALRRISDRRLDALDTIAERAKAGEGRDLVLRSLKRIAADPGDSHEAVAIRGSRPPLTDLNLRVLRRWARQHYAMNSRVPIERMCREALNNPNYKITWEVRRIAQFFPDQKTVPRRVWPFVINGGVAFPYQAAEFVRGLRLYSDIPDGAYDWARSVAIRPSEDPYLRQQCVLLLSRVPTNDPSVSEIIGSCLACPDLRVVQAGIMAASLASPKATAEFLRGASLHASHDASRVVQYIRALRYDAEPRHKLLRHIFQGRLSREQLLYEFAPFIRFIASGSPASAEQLRDLLKAELRRRRHSKSYREFIEFLYDRCEATLARHALGALQGEGDG